jgi:hypothetical protein
MPKMATRIVIGLGLIGVLAGVGWLDAVVFERPLASRILLWALAVLTLHEVITIAARRVECYPGLPIFGAVAVLAVVLSAFWAWPHSARHRPPFPKRPRCSVRSSTPPAR